MHKVILLFVLAVVVFQSAAAQEDLPSQDNGVCVKGSDDGDCEVSEEETEPLSLDGPKYVGELKMLQYSDGREVDPFAFRIGLPANVTNHLRRFILDMGITKVVQDIMNDGEYDPGQNETERILGKKWFIYRPPNKESNAHWMYPKDEKAYDHVLRVMGDGNFYVALDSIGQHFGLESLTVYSVGLVAISYCETMCEQEYLHDVGNKTFNLLIPLNLHTKNATMSQHYIHDRDDPNVTVAAKYEYDVAIGVGDGTKHAVCDCDFEETGGVRLMASIHIAEIDEDNIKSIAKQMPPAPYPPPDEEFMLKWKGLHWKKDGDAELPKDWQSKNLPVDSLKPAPTEIGKLTLIEFADGTIVDPFAFRIRFPEKLTQTLIDYCKDMGLPEMFSELMTPEGEYEAGGDKNVLIKGHKWYISRPPKKWHSNSHWLNPMDEEAQDHFLRMLGDGGFDLVLDAIGKHYGLDGLVCYSVGFFVVNHSDNGYMHHDFKNVNGKAFNLLLPVELVEDKVSNLSVESVDYTNVTVQVGYEPHVAVGVGDETRHAAGDCDFRDSGGKRVMVTIYLADIDKQNVEYIIEHYTDPYPPAEEVYLLSRSGTHWSSDGLTHLPHGDARTEEEQQLRPGPTEPGEVSPLQWKDGVSIDPYSFRVGIPDSLTKALQDYCKDMGLTKLFHELMGPGRLDTDSWDYAEIQGFNWYLQRPKEEYYTTAHWLNPTDEDALQQFLRVLGDGGFDRVLDGIGRHFDLDGLVCYSVGFLVLDQCRDSVAHYDFKRINGKGFNIFFPITLPEDSLNATHFVRARNDPNLAAKVKYEYNTAIGVGDFSRHAPGDMDYRDTGEMVVLATLYIVDVNDVNVENFLKEMTDPFPPKKADYFLDRRGIHWTKDGSTRLPREYSPPPEADSEKTYTRKGHGTKAAKLEESESSTSSSLLPAPTEPGELSLIRFSNGEVIDPYAFRIGLPLTLTKVLRKYCKEKGLLKVFSDLMNEDTLDPDEDEEIELHGTKYYIQRPHEDFHSTAHWLNPMDEEGFEEYLRVLGEGGMDVVLEGIGRHFGLDGLTCYSAGFVVLDECKDGYTYYDFQHVDGKAFSLNIPLMMDTDIDTEHYIQSRDDEDVEAEVPYQYNVALGVGDNTKQTIGDIDYKVSSKVVILATLYVADINEENIENLLKDFTDPFPPKDRDYFLERRGIHWKKDGSVQLPRY